jgi:vancomycin resistance protein YoaR
VDTAGLLPALTQWADRLLNGFGEGGDPPTADITIAPPAEPDFEAIRQELYAEVAEAYLDRETLEIVPSITGKDLDVEAAQSALDRAEEGQSFRVELAVTEPEITTEALREMLFRDVLGEATTRVTGTADRKMNVGVAAEFINGTVLFPGEEFSFNQKCSPYTEANGYGKATAYVNGLSKDTVAGGICQASSTLYWASLMANLETVERYAHRYEPSYVRGGLDATVYGDYGEEGSLDFRFKNNTQYPIKIEVSMDSKNYILVTIRGTDVTGIHGQPYSTNREVTKPYETIYQADASIPQGTTQKDPERTGYNAVTIDTYQKLVDADGKVVSEELLYQTKYKLRNEVLLFNPADLELWGIDPFTGIRTEPTPAPEEPVESGDPSASPSPVESGAPVDSPSPILPPDMGGDPILPPGEETPPPAEGSVPPTLPMIPPPGTIVVGQ